MALGSWYNCSTVVHCSTKRLHNSFVNYSQAATIRFFGLSFVFNV